METALSPEFAMFLQSMEMKAAQKSQASSLSISSFGRDDTVDLFAQDFLAVRIILFTRLGVRERALVVLIGC